MQLAPNVVVDDERLAAFCRQHGIRRLSLFGSALSEDFGSSSDVDMLVEFEPDRIPGFLKLAAYERELSDLLGGCQIDLRTAGGLSVARQPDGTTPPPV